MVQLTKPSTTRAHVSHMWRHYTKLAAKCSVLISCGSRFASPRPHSIQDPFHGNRTGHTG